MEIFNIIAIVICVTICLCFAPFMTIGVIFIMAESFGKFGDAIGAILLIIGFARMINDVFE